VLPQQFSIDRRASEKLGQVHLSVRGDVDLYTAPKLREALASEKRNGRGVRLDLEDVEFMDSTGLKVLVQAVTDAAADGWQLQLGSISETVRVLLHRTGLEDLVRVEPLGDG
jgi:anti-sigma B factor antagonist